MRASPAIFILGFLIALNFPSPIHAQITNTLAADTNVVSSGSISSGQAPGADVNAVPAIPPSVTANPAPSVNQTPDDVLAKLSGLIHAAKYAEAQQLTAGLLLAYPSDERLTKAKILLDKLLAAPAPAVAVAIATPAATIAEPAAPKLTGMDKVEYNSLIELGRQAQQNADLEQQKKLLQQFMEQSGPFLQKHPDELLIWQLRAATALSLNDMIAGYESGQKFLASGLADNDPNLQHLLAQLNLKGWLNKQRAEAQKKRDTEAGGFLKLKEKR